MAQATKTDGQWTILPGGEPVHHDDVVASYETVQGWSQGEREAFGVFDIGEGLSPPAGYRISSSEIGEREERPIWVHSFKPIPSARIEVVTMRQAKLALLYAGLLDEADAAIAALTGTEGRAAQIEWEYASELCRAHPMVAQLGVTLGLDDAAIDALFANAAQIA